MSETTVLAPADYAAELEAALARPQPDSLRTLRRGAFERFVERGFPAAGEEEWRFTNVGAVTRTRFVRPSEGDSRELDRATLDGARLDGTHELVFLDGRFAPELSSPGGLPAGIRFGALREAVDGDWGRLEPLLGRKADIVDRPFAALSTALFEDGAWIEIEAGARVEKPLHVLFFSSGGEAPTAVFPRLLVRAGEGSEATLVESHAGREGSRYLVAPVAEIVACEGALLDHAKLQRDGLEAFHLSALHVEAGRDSRVVSRTYSLGAAIARHDVQAVLAGEGSEVTLDGLYMVRGRQLADYHMRVDHAKPHTTSHELFKGVLDGRSRGVFNGRIHVHPQAQKTDAKQSSRNLLLSGEALVNANPQLEIFADDVKCTHGSTVGQLDEEAVFYLRSRGIGLEAARSLLTYAFAADLVERARVDALRERLQEFLFAWIPQGEVVREAV